MSDTGHPGQAGRIWTGRQVDVLMSMLGGRCEGIMLDRCGHAPHIDQRATVAELMARFIRDL
jgi:hypothetical protein